MATRRKGDEAKVAGRARQRAGETTEADFLRAYDPTKYERSSLAVDVVVMSAKQGALHVALTRRADHPHKGRHALPGGFVGLKESLDAAAARVLLQKAGLKGVFLEQLYTFGAVQRDPRGRVVSVSYYALVTPERLDEVARAGHATIAKLDVPWKGETGGPVDVVDAEGEPLELAFDHADMLGMAVKRVRGKIDWAPLGFQLLPPAFTLRALQEVYETVLGEAMNKDSFRRRMLQSGLVEATGERETDVSYRPAELYRFVKGRSV